MRRTVVKMVMAAAGVLILGLLGGFLGPWKKETGETVLHFGMMAGSYWDVPTGNCYQVIDSAICRFEEAHPGVRVEYVSGILKEDYPEWLAEQVLLGTEPDVFMVPAGEFDLLASMGVLENLDSFIRRDSSFHPEDYYACSYDYGQRMGVQYGLPYESVPTLMFVNKTLLKQENIPMPDSSWTWDQFLAICRQVTKDTDGDGVTDQFGCYDYGWQDAVSANGAVLFDQEGTQCWFGDIRVEEAVRFVRELETVNQGFTVTSREFDKGKVAFMPLPYSEYRTYKPYPWRIKKYSDFTWDCVKMPSGPKGDGGSRVDTLLMAMGQRSGSKKLAWEFLKTLCYERQTQEQLMQDSQGVSVLKEVVRSSGSREFWIQDAPGGSTLDAGVLSQVMEAADAAPGFRLYPDAMETADIEIRRMLTGELSMDSGLLKLQREINRLLKQ